MAKVLDPPGPLSFNDAAPTVKTKKCINHQAMKQMNTHQAVKNVQKIYYLCKMFFCKVYVCTIYIYIKKKKWIIPVAPVDDAVRAAAE